MNIICLLIGCCGVNNLCSNFYQKCFMAMSMEMHEEMYDGNPWKCMRIYKVKSRTVSK